jgi:hypothetical protein
MHADDLFHTPLDQAQIDFENEGGETYICGNPPYIGDKMQLPDHKSDVEFVLSDKIERWKSLDYVCAFFAKGIELVRRANCSMAFVTTKSIVQGQQVSIFWPSMLDDVEFSFANKPFRWANLASQNAGVTCVIIGIAHRSAQIQKRLFDDTSVKLVDNISPYLTDGPSVFIEKSSNPISNIPTMRLGNVLKDDGHLQLDEYEESQIVLSGFGYLVRSIVGSTEFIRGTNRKCLYIREEDLENANFPEIVKRKLELTAQYRNESRAPALRELAKSPNIFYFHLASGKRHTIVVPRVTSENRDYLPVGFLGKGDLISDRNYGVVDAPTWVISIIASRLHWVWIGTVCVRMRTDFSYSKPTFPRWPPREGRLRARLPYGTALRNRIFACWRFSRSLTLQSGNRSARPAQKA